MKISHLFKHISPIIYKILIIAVIFILLLSNISFSDNNTTTVPRAPIFSLSEPYMTMGMRAAAEERVITSETDLMSALIDKIQSIEIPHIYTEDDIYILAQMIHGECYEFNLEDQRNAAIVVCNRVDDPQFQCSSITEVIYTTGFYGYYPYGIPSENNLRIAREVVEDWEARTNGYPIERPWHNYLFFSSNGTFSNEYRTEYLING